VRAGAVQKAEFSRLAVFGRVLEQHQILPQHTRGLDRSHTDGRVQRGIKFIHQRNRLPIVAHQLATRRAGANTRHQFILLCSHAGILRENGPIMAQPMSLQSLPLFPLGSVLFPGGSLPLRIFEVRYLDMIGKCHKAGAPFGVVALTSGSEVQKPAANGLVADNDAAGKSAQTFAPESFHRFGTLATISEFSAPQPGFMVIRCTGTQRFRIERQQRLNYGLWIADVTRIADDTALEVPLDLRAAAVALDTVIISLKARGVPEAQLPFAPPYHLKDCAWVANRWCELLPLPMAQKQQLMALDNPLVRLELVSDILRQAGIIAA
jgi:uncharacterized protein